jgi:uncharacterized protein (TIGR03083 family)
MGEVMEVTEHVAAIRRDGELLAGAAEAAGLDAPVPTCPEWRVRDLVQHIGGVHRWAATYVAEARAEPMPDDEADRLMAPPEDAELLDWFREGYADLAATLEKAPSDVDCWSFLPAPTPLRFWARRQAHETAIHRADAESAGGAVTPYPPEHARDGLDELLLGLASRRRGRLRADPPRSFALHAGDLGADWLVRVEPDRIQVSHEPGEADWSVSGPASDLYLLLWNRRGPEGLETRGDPALLQLWRASVRVRWS